jgi:hypothetical protein
MVADMVRNWHKVKEAPLVREIPVRIILVVWLLAMGVVLVSPTYDSYIWYQVEQQALAADLVEGAQE